MVGQENGSDRSVIETAGFRKDMVMRMENQILICEDSLEGIFSAIYEAYTLQADYRHISLQTGDTENFTLFSDYIPIETDERKAGKVARTIQRRLGMETYEDICYALASEEAGKATAVYRTVAIGLAMRDGRAVMGNLTEEPVRLVAQLKRRVWNEAHHLLGFVRFQELENHILFSKIGPKNNVIPFLGEHFADRLPLEHFVIYDETRGIFLIHPAGKMWFCVRGETLDEESAERYSDREREYQELFKHFCRKIAIKERENRVLQQQLLPLRFQQYMTEFRE